MNFILSCGAVLQKYDAERDADRDEYQRKHIAAMWGVELKDTQLPKSSNGRKQTQTQQDLMRNYGREG